MSSLFTFLLNSLNHKLESQVNAYEKNSITGHRTRPLSGFTFHDVPASLISEFAEKIVRPYYNGNLNAAIQDLIKKALAEQDFVLSHITHVRNPMEA